MDSSKILLLTLLTVILWKPTTQFPKDSVPAVSDSNTAKQDENAKSAKSLAEEIRSKANEGSTQQKNEVTNKLFQLGIGTGKPEKSINPEDQVLQGIRDQILQGTNEEDDLLQQVRDGDLFNAFHEAIDEKIIDPSFIETLASVGKPPLINKYTRDTLMIKSIREDVNFTFGENVYSWKALQHANKDQHLIVGLSAEGIVILYETSGEFSLQQEIPMETVPSAFEVINVWNSTAEASVSCLVVATETSLIWYSMRSTANFSLIEEWRWPLLKTTTVIKFIHYKDIDMILLVGTHPNKQKTISATLYEFNFEKQQFWLMQKLVLQFPCKSIGIVNIGSEFLVAFPQNNTAMVYTLEMGKEYRGKISLIANFTSEQINSVGAFQIGRFAYIAIGGESPQILRYSNGNFTSQTVPSETLETVESFIELPTRTYRDDLILLVQHRLAFSTHEVQRLEILVWNGEYFDIRSNIPCYVEDDIMDNEVSCLLDLHRPTGIAGSAIVQRDKQVSMIIPRSDAHSSLFHFEISMLSAENPITQKEQEIRDTIDAFTKILVHQDVVIKQALDLIAQAENNDKPMVLDNCLFESVEADVVYLDSNFQWPDDNIIVGDVVWTQEDSAIDVAALLREMEYEEAQLLRLESELEFAIPKNHGPSLDLKKPLRVGHLTVEGSLVTDNLYVRRLEEAPPVQGPRPAEPIKELRVKDLEVRHLNFEFFNGEPASELVFNVGDSIVLGNKIVFEETVVAENAILPEGGTVNGIDLSESMVYFNNESRRWKNLVFDQLEVTGDVIVHDLINGEKLDLDEMKAKFRDATSKPKDVLTADTLVLNGSLHFKTLNGIPWEDIVEGLVMKNKPNHLAELRIEGNLILEHPNITVDRLNDFAFPGSFLFSNSPTESIVTGHKRFTNITYINTLDIGGTLNGIDLKDIITLHDDQHIPGNVTIGKLHVYDELEVRGEILGEQMDQLLDNPTLEQTTHVKAACHFRELIVDGPVIIQETLDGEDLDAILSEVVYDTERNVEITGLKRFESVEFYDEVIIRSGLVNDIKLEEFVTRSTEQTLDVDEIRGDIFIDNLTLGGLFDGMNATHLELNSIKLYGDQYTNATLIFENPPGSTRPDIEANVLNISEMLNSKRRSEYVDTDQDEIVVTGNFTIPSLNVENLYLISSTIDGPSKQINDVHLPTFDSLRFSLTRPQQIDVPFYVHKLFVTNEINASYINGQDFRFLKKNIQKVQNIRNNIMLEEMHIENLFVEGDLQVNMLNGINFDQLLQEVIWLNRPNYIPGTVHFLDPLHIKGNLTVKGLINKVNFTEFLDDVVLKSDEVAEFYGTMTFLNGLVIEENLETEIIDNIPIKDLILKNQSIVLHGDLEIVGQMNVEHLLVSDRFNDQPIQDLLELYEYDPTRDMHVIKGDVYFNNVSIESLNIRGGLDEIPNVDRFLDSLIRKDQDYYFTQPIVFEKEVVIDKDFNIGKLDGIDISNLQHDIVRINQEAPVELDADAVFLNPVHIEKLTVEGDLIVPSIGGFDPDWWQENAVMTNENAEIRGKIIFAPGTFKADHIQTQYINDLPMDKLITLNTDQTFDGTLHVDKLTITQPLEVGGLINGISFPEERENTLMTYGTQFVTVPTVEALHSLTLPPIVDDKPIEPELVIESPITFGHLIDDPHETGDTNSGRDQQTTGARVLAKRVRFGSDVKGKPFLSGVEIQEAIDQMKATKTNVDDNLQSFQSQLRSFCWATRDLVAKTQSRVYFFKYFAQRQVINEHRPIGSFHFFDNLEYHFLAVNFDCQSHFYQWDPTAKMFVLLFKAHTGVIGSWKTVVNSDRAIFLVTLSTIESTKCNITGVSVWLFTGEQLQTWWNTAGSASIQAISSDPLKLESFFVLNVNHVTEYNLIGNVLQQWELPESVPGYRFIPSEVGMGTALSDGKLLVQLPNLNRSEQVIRTKRKSNETVEMALFSPQAMYDRIHKNFSSPGRLRRTKDGSWVTTDTIKPDDLVTKEHTKQSNGTLVYTDKSTQDKLPYYELSRDDSTTQKSSLVESRTAKEIPLDGILTVDNQHFPNHPSGDIVAFRAGPLNKKRHLVAVSTVMDTTVNGKQDAIKIYLNIQNGQLYQVLSCHRPSHLTTLELRDETILAFLESRQTVQIYIYRGPKGFVWNSSFRLASPAIQMSGVSVPQHARFMCPVHYLAIATEQQELVLLEAKTQGDCGLVVDVNCDIED
ncbi:uncharacterized protein LOC131685473 [Topomyia yanbarensis]|uniref:uncharacterized protein LOC131685473 n=1 Tax=Topomyia yanbarensis TaxID=2498891 RepID=UPI00273C9DDD|nr:uncharacterized protein LOC131685473 [Topomyia yanbarensis]